MNWLGRWHMEFIIVDVAATFVVLVTYLAVVIRKGAV
jgi:hypothetical protein